MKIIIVGPGALGSLLAARLSLFLSTNSEHTNETTSPIIWMLDYKRQRANRLNSQGFILEEQGRKVNCSIRSTSDPQIIGNSDVLILCVKSHSVSSALTCIAPLLSHSTLLIGMQNGIDHIDHIMGSSAIPVAGITSEGATLKKAGYVIHGGAGITRLGFLREGHNTDVNKLNQLTSLLSRSGLHSEITATPLQHIWAKLFVNVAINALTALHDKPNGWLLSSKSCRKIMTEAVREAEKIAYALNVPVLEDPVQAAFQVCEATSSNISSMLQDVRKKRITEIEAINGAIVKEGKKLAIPTPFNEELVTRIKKLENSYINQRK